MTTTAPGLFACKKISFPYPFYGGQQVKVFASFGHAVASSSNRYGAAIWVESVSTSGFTACVLEFGDGSNGTAEVNWVALQSTPPESQLGTASLKTWTTGTECQKIDFQTVRFISLFPLASYTQQPFIPFLCFALLFLYFTLLCFKSSFLFLLLFHFHFS